MLILPSLTPIASSIQNKKPIPVLPPIKPNNTLNSTFIPWDLIPLTNTGYEDLVYMKLLLPVRYAYMDFSEVDNSTLRKLLIHTVYSIKSGVKIPSNRVYVSQGELHLTSTSHLVLNTSLFKKVKIPVAGSFLQDDNILVVAYVRFISGGSRQYSRGGIGFYTNRGLVESEDNVFYHAGNYWISVLGTFNGRGVSYDFEGHWSINGGKWVFSESVSRQVYDKGKEYILVIGKSGSYVFGGIISNVHRKAWAIKTVDLDKVYYIKDQVGDLIEVVAHKAHIAIRRIEIYKLIPLALRSDAEMNFVYLKQYNKYLRVLRQDRNKYIKFSIDSIDYDNRIAYFSVKVLRYKRSLFPYTALNNVYMSIFCIPSNLG